MSMPIIERPDNPIDREQAVSNLIESVALMEAGLSHVINAEGEKIQKVADPDADYPLEDIVAVNNSAEKMINTISKLEMMLQSKLEAIKELDTGTDPTPIIEESGAIINYNHSAIINTTMAGLPNEGAVLTFESSNNSLNIDFNGNIEEFELPLSTASFPMPRDGIITSISAFFEVNSVVANDTQVVARVYKADSASNTFSALEGTTVNLTPLIPAGSGEYSVVGSLTDLNIPVEINSKLAMVFYCTSTGNTTVTGIAGASLNIM